MRRLVLPSTLAIFVLVLFGVVVWFVPPADRTYPPLTSRSNQPDGARALALWLQSLGYRVEELDTVPFAVDPATSLLFMLEPAYPLVTEQEAEHLLGWVADGGTLVVATGIVAPVQLLSKLGVERVYAPGGELAYPAQPLLIQPPVDSVPIPTGNAFQDLQGDMVPLLADGDRIRAGQVARGRGRVVIIADGDPFSNAGLRNPGSAALVMNLLRMASPAALVQFDEVHHGLGRDSSGDLAQLLVDTSLGRALLWAAGLTFLFLVLTGRRFGRAVSPPHQYTRSAGEYVAAMAALYRRAGQRAFVAEHFEREMRREANRALGLEAAASEAELAERARSRGRDAGPLIDTLATLRRPALSEAELLRLVREGEAQLGAVGRRPAPAGRARRNEEE